MAQRVGDRWEGREAGGGRSEEPALQERTPSCSCQTPHLALDTPSPACGVRERDPVVCTGLRCSRVWMLVGDVQGEGWAGLAEKGVRVQESQEGRSWPLL